MERFKVRNSVKSESNFVSVNVLIKLNDMHGSVRDFLKSI